jgi:hypothetical protein
VTTFDAMRARGSPCTGFRASQPCEEYAKVLGARSTIEGFSLPSPHPISIIEAPAGALPISNALVCSRRPSASNAGRTHMRTTLPRIIIRARIHPDLLRPSTCRLSDSPFAEPRVYSWSSTARRNCATSIGSPRLLVRSDDPTKSLGGYPFSVGDGKVYLTVSEFESDIYGDGFGDAIEDRGGHSQPRTW